MQLFSCIAAAFLLFANRAYSTPLLTPPIFTTPICKGDLIYVVDASGSIGQTNFNTEMKNFLKDLTDGFTVSPSDTAVGVVKFSTTVSIECLLTGHANKQSVKDAITAMTWDGLGSKTYTWDALTTVENSMLGDIGVGDRPTEENIVLLVTDGNPSDGGTGQTLTTDAVNSLKTSGATIMTLGIGGLIDENYLKSLATSTADHFVVSTFGALQGAINAILARICVNSIPTTTTTTTSTTTKTAAQQDPGLDLCRDCKLRDNQRDYFPYAADCHKYIHCEPSPNAPGYITHIVACPPGEFWHDAVMSCVPDVNPDTCGTCCRDPCLPFGVGHPSESLQPNLPNILIGDSCWYYTDNPCYYFHCSNTGSNPFCCPEGVSFNLADCACTNNGTALEPCPDGWTCPHSELSTFAPSTKAGTNDCSDGFGNDFAAIPGDAAHYWMYDNTTDGYQVMPCPAGTLFSFIDCHCMPGGNAFTELRKPCVLHMMCDGDSTDSSIYNRYVSAHNGESFVAGIAGTSACSYDGTNHHEVPGLQTFDYKNDYTVCAHVKCASAGCQGAIVSTTRNDADVNGFSYRMGYDSASAVTAYVNLWHPAAQYSVSAPVGGNSGFNHYCMRYDGSSFALFVNGVLSDPGDEVPTNGGDVLPRHCPFTVGTGHLFDPDNFIGCIDDVLVCDSALTSLDMIAHRDHNYNFLQAQNLIPSP